MKFFVLAATISAWIIPCERALAIERLNFHSVPNLVGALENVAQEQALRFDPSSSAFCGPKYTNLFPRGEIDIRVLFGYADSDEEWDQSDSSGTATDSFKNAEPFDRYLAEAFRRHLKLPCSRFQEGFWAHRNRANANKAYFACDFSEEKNDRDVLTREIQSPSGEKFRIKIQIASSTAQSAQAREAYRDALAHGDVVFYVGHARKGGGPDFFPAQRDRSGQIAYADYQRKRPGVKDTLEALTRRKDGGPALIGLLACDSERLFLKDLRKVSPRSAFIVSKGLSNVDDSFRSLGASVNALLSLRCEETLKPALNPGRNKDADHFVIRGEF